VISSSQVSLAQLRRFGLLLLAFFVLAQVAGVVPSISTHIEHTVKTEQDIAADFGQRSAPITSTIIMPATIADRTSMVPMIQTISVAPSITTWLVWFRLQALQVSVA
jgi:hypothetical protein